MRSTPALAFLALISACAHRPPRATAPVRQLTEQGKALLADAPISYSVGKSAPKDLGQRFETGLSVPCTHDDRLDVLAEVLADTMVTTSQLPARSLTQWLMWREGVLGELHTVQAWSASGDAELVLEKTLIDYAAMVEPDSRGAPLRYGVARSLDALRSEWAQVLVLTTVPLEVDALPKRVAHGEKLTLKGRLNVKAVKPKLFLDDSDTAVRELELEPAADGTFTVTFDAPSTAGRRFLEVTALDADETPERPQWMHPLLMLPLHVDVAEPNEPDALIRTPAPNPASLEAWASRALQLYNARRAAAGLKALTLDPIATRVALDAAKTLAQREDAPPDPNLLPRLAQAGLPTRHAQQQGGRVEFLDEATTISLYSPSLRQTLMDPSVSVVGIAYAPVVEREGRVPHAMAGSSIFVQPVGTLDVAAEANALAAGLNRYRKAAGTPELELDPKFSALAMAHVKSACDGNAAPLDAMSGQANALGYSGGLAMTYAVTHLLPADLRREDKLIKATGTHVAVGACQAGGVERVVFLISSKVVPAAAPTAPAAPARRGK